MNLAKISANGQITVPIEIRRKLMLEEGDKILFIERDGEIVISNASEPTAIKTQQNYQAAEEDVKVMEESMQGIAEGVGYGRKSQVYKKLSLDKIKASVRTVAQDYPIKKVYLFGSYAEGTNTETSDMDFLVEFMDPSISLITLSSLRHRLQEELNTEVDLIHGPLEQNALITLGKVVPIYEQ